jgi:hypothetical protein
MTKSSTASVEPEIPLPKTQTDVIPDISDDGTYAKHIAEMQRLEREDNQWKLDARKRYGKIFVILLIAQNIVVFGLVIWAFCLDKLQPLSLVLAIIVNGTLVETAFLIRFIIKWIFADIDYKNNTNKSSNTK